MASSASKAKPSGSGPSKVDSQAPGLNIKSYIRVRPLHTGEKKSVNLEISKKHISIKSSPDCKSPKVFTFDRVFEEGTKQVAVYSTVLKPMINEVIQGYNCTVFAYGQTGTGKTYTMSGNLGSSGEDNMDAGIIPRALDDIFSELSMKSHEFQISIMFLELYCEKLINLLSNTGDEDTEIKIVEDGEGKDFVLGVSPTIVKNKEDAFKLLKKGCEKKQMASTLLNSNSSRSHTILTVCVNVKETSLDKHDLLRVGKLHLVDLAGSENVSRSGTLQQEASSSGGNKRKNETVNINKSLLALGRVITSITENHQHIPYRESKLTRILRDSLGGKTKTCIVATISPSHITMDETESTISYACKARNIKNKPEKNQTISKKGFMQVASDEILKLKRDLEAVRQGDGFYISNETHEEMIKNIETLDVKVKEWNDRYTVIEARYEQLKEQFASLSDDFGQKSVECDELDKLFQLECEKVQRAFDEQKKERIVREYLIDQYKKTEENLTDQAKQCKSVLENIFDQNKKLHGKIDAQKENETMNSRILEGLKTNLEDKLNEVENVFKRMVTQEEYFSKNINHSAATLCDTVNSAFGEIKYLIKMFRIESSERYKETLYYAEKVDETMNLSLRGTVWNEKEIFTNFVNLLDKAYHTFQVMLEKVKGKIDTAVTKSSKIQEDLSQALIDLKPEDTSENLQRLITSISADIIKVLNEHESKIDQAVEHANQSKLSSEDVYEKITRISEDFKELQIAMKGSCDKAQESHVNVESLKSHFSQSKKNIQASVVEKDLVTRLAFNEVIIKLTRFGKNLDDGHQQQTQQLESVQVDVENLESGFHRDANNLHQSLITETDCCDERLTIAFGKENVIQQMKDNTDYLHSYTQRYWADNKDNIKNKEEDIEQNLRQIQTDISTNLEVAIQTHTKGLQEVADVKDVICNMKYTPTLQQGTTPKKVLSEELNYPKEFDATAPVDVLLKKFDNQLKQEDSSTMLPHQPSGSSESTETERPRRSSSWPKRLNDKKEFENKENMRLQDLISTKKHNKNNKKRSPLKTTNKQVLQENNSFKQQF